MKKLNIALIVTLALLLIAGCTQSTPKSTVTATPAPIPSGPPIEIKFAHGFGPQNPEGIAGQALVDAIKSKFGNRVNVSYYPAGQLFDTTACHREIKSGGIHITEVWTSYLQSFWPLWGVAEYPFLFNNADHFIASLKGSVEGKKLLDGMAADGITITGEPSQLKYGQTKYIFSSKPVNSLADFKGLKLRNPGGWMAGKILDNFGVSNVAISIAEFSTSLQQGMVDGTMTNANGWNIWSQLFEQRAANILNFQISAAYPFAAVNTTWWNGLPADIRDGLKPLLQDFSNQTSKLYLDNYGVMWDRINTLNNQGKFGIVTPSAEFAKSIIDTQSPLYNDYIKQVPSAGGIIDYARSIAGRYPN